MPSSRKTTAGSESGVTLIELMVAVTVLAVIVTVAVPGLQQFILLTGLRSYSDAIAVDAILARSEALKRNRTVKLCASNDGAACTVSAWGDGWIVIDESVPTVISSHGAVKSNFLVNEADDKASLSFPPSGIGVTTASFTVCRSDPVGSEERVVQIGASGLPLITKATAGSCS